MKKSKILYEEGQKVGEMYFIQETLPNVYFDGKRNRKRRKGLFLCFCGKIKETLFDSVVAQKTISCGCVQDSHRLPPPVNIKHGHAVQGKRSSEYRAWAAMKTRCKGTTKENKKLYTDKGITVCIRWKTSFKNFYEDMGPKPSKNHSLDRKDGNLGYYKENCRWATVSEQNRNKSSNILASHNGEIKCATDWARILGLSHSGFVHRLNNYSTRQQIFKPKIIEPKLQ